MTGSHDRSPPRDSTLSSVRNAARLLKEFGPEDREIGVTELSRRLHISKSTAHRLLHTLTEEGLLDQDPTTGAYRLSLTVFALGSSVWLPHDLRGLSAPVLELLRSQTRETVEVLVLDGRRTVAVERREGQVPRAPTAAVGQHVDAHLTSGGKVLLAALTLPRLESLLDGWTLAQCTAYTITSHDLLRDALARVRDQGWAESVNEAGVGIASVAAPIRDARGDIAAALSVTGPTPRFTGDLIRSAVRPTVEAAQAISRRLGYQDTAGAE